MGALRTAVGLFASGCIALTGCSTPPDGPTAATPTTSSPTSAPGPRLIDLAGLSAVASDFPVGQTPNPLFGPVTLSGQRYTEVGDLVSFGEPIEVSPDECRVLLKPVAASTGVEQASVTSATGPSDPFISVSAYDPVSVEMTSPPQGCARFGYEVEGAIPDGTIELLPSPTIDGAQTYAMRSIVGSDGTSGSTSTAEYFYYATLDDRTFVNVWARMPQDFVPEPALPDLLTKAVAAIRRS